MTKYLIDGKCKMSGFIIFEIKHAKMDKIFNYLRNPFSVMSSLMDMIFGMFSQANVRLLKKIISQFLSKYIKCSKRCNISNVKSSLKLTNSQLITFDKNTGHDEDVKLHVSNRTLQELFRMALRKSVSFVVFQILRNLISM